VFPKQKKFMPRGPGFAKLQASLFELRPDKTPRQARLWFNPWKERFVIETISTFNWSVGVLEYCITE
jgi:hypothetical protein